MKLLYIDACVRKESRTRRISDALLAMISEKYPEDVINVEKLILKDEDLHPLSEDGLDARTDLINRQAWDDPMFRYSRQFADADIIIISAPYWDGSFPSILKLYIENIYVQGIVSGYDENGRPVGMCRAEKLYYVTTSGGPYDGRYSYDYIDTLATSYFGIRETQLIKADMLDIIGYDAAEIVNKTIAEL
ncbi:MAG: NAD(P)H-dependent oxidoreductase [Parasporobacterium sp.]|nr:NAD(P)H-dependent oxidoreductase [Parasporobacterium sp.]